MQRYMVNEDLKLDSGDISHITSVMRMKVNDKFEMVNNGNVYTCKITNISKKEVSYEVVDQYTISNDKNFKVVIASALIKEQKMDYLLQKATELGVDEIIPIVTERTIVKIDKKIENKINRWTKIMKEASEQSHRASIPKISSITTIKELLKCEYDIKIFCNTKENDKNIKKVLQDHTKFDTILVVVGPEGGFTDKEVDLLIKNGFISTTLGANILRAETVPLYILSVINYEFLR